MSRKEEIQQAAIKEFPRFAERRVGFIAGVEWADKTMIEKACEWLEKELLVSDLEIQNYYLLTEYNKRIFINDFRKALEQ